MPATGSGYVLDKRGAYSPARLNRRFSRQDYNWTAGGGGSARVAPEGAGERAVGSR